MFTPTYQTTVGCYLGTYIVDATSMCIHPLAALPPPPLAAEGRVAHRCLGVRKWRFSAASWTPGLNYAARDGGVPQFFHGFYRSKE